MTGAKVQEVDVLIVGSGSAGLTAATWLARRGVSCTILESRSGPLLRGQADGVQCRTVEIFQSFGLAEELLREAHHVLEVTFWSDNKITSQSSTESPADNLEHGTIEKRFPGETSSVPGIFRTSRTADTPLGWSHQPHVILNQARVNELLLGAMAKFNGQGVIYGVQVKKVEVDETAAKDWNAHCVTVIAEGGSVEKVYNARFVLGCDGAHSAVRKSLGIPMVGDTSDAVWGVMDVFARTDFPDMRKKVVIKTQSRGSMLIVPREGGALVRFYVELTPGTIARNVTLDALLTSARDILSPYSLDVCETVWWSAYSIGQRVAGEFSVGDRVFLTGDACHTHSPKSGQGMNTSLQDGYNLGWKLAAVLKGEAIPDVLKTYALERGDVARTLIAFDREFAKSFSSRSHAVETSHLIETSAALADSGQQPSTAESFTERFVQAKFFTTGLAVKYQQSLIVNTANAKAHLATGLTVGMRFPSAQVVRYCDARALQLAETLCSDGRWRLIIFGGDIRGHKPATSRLSILAHFLDSPNSPIRRCTPPRDDIDSVIECIVVLYGERSAIEQNDIPDVFMPTTGKYKIRDTYKIFVDDESYNSGHGHAYERYGIGAERGALVIVRPDQYISAVIEVDDHEFVENFFREFQKTA